MTDHKELVERLTTRRSSLHGDWLAAMSEAASVISSLVEERDRLVEALKPFGGLLVYSFEDDPSTIHVTYGGQTLAILELDSEAGTEALKLEQELAAARTAMRKP